jgi:hypothetical protein
MKCFQGQLQLDFPFCPPLKIQSKRRRNPATAVVFMVPSKNISTVNNAVCIDRKGKLISVPSVTEKQQMFERHVEVSKAGELSKLQIVVNDPFDGPKQP